MRLRRVLVLLSSIGACNSPNAPMSDPRGYPTSRTMDSVRFERAVPDSQTGRELFAARMVSNRKRGGRRRLVGRSLAQGHNGTTAHVRGGATTPVALQRRTKGKPRLHLRCRRGNGWGE